jgi:uncharacterized protein (DUF1919 family)
MGINEQKIIWRNRIYSRIAKRRINLNDISIISMNCIGGIVYHDCGKQFLSPTIDLFFLPSDFIKFVNNLDFYLNETPRVVMGSQFPVGIIGDIRLYFMHYKTSDEALEKWEERKKRINRNKIFVIMVERNGFSDDDFENFKRIKYPKILFTKSKKYDCEDAVYYKQYEMLEQLPDIIPGRYMYYKGRLFSKLNELS